MMLSHKRDHLHVPTRVCVSGWSQMVHVLRLRAQLIFLPLERGNDNQLPARSGKYKHAGVNYRQDKAW